MPKPFPKEFRRDVIAVARKGDQSIAQVARSFGVSESWLARWLKIADREDGLADMPHSDSRSVSLECERPNVSHRPPSGRDQPGCP